MKKFKKKEISNLEHISKGKDLYIDNRGAIANYKLSEKINLVATISSKKNTLRSNHYHPIQQQKCLLVKGQYISVYQDLKNKNSPKITHLINEGDLVTTEPLVGHTMVFTKDSLFLNLVNGEREHKNYGKTHTIPIELVNKNEKEFLYKNYKFDCRVCENKIFKRILSLGFQPYANNFSKDKHQDKFPLEINLCEKCFNSQLSILPNFKKLFTKYLYKSSVSKEFSNHFSEAALNYIKKLQLKKKSFIIDVGSNDGVGLLPFKNLGYKNLLGIEPAKNLANITKKKNIKVISSFLNLKTIKKIKKKADLILASNVFAHADNLEEMLICMLKLLKKNGNIVIEVQYFAKMINDLSFDNIYHEHVNYWTLDSLINFTSKYNCKIYKAEEIDTHGGSLRIYINKKKNTKTDLSIHKILKNEQKLKLKDFRTYEKFQKKINNLKKIVNENLGNLKKIYGELIGYGAPAKASTSINYFNIDKNIIKFVVDENQLKINKFIPGTDIIIKSKNNIQNNHKCIIVFAWNMLQEIKKKYKNKNINFISIRELQKKL